MLMNRFRMIRALLFVGVVVGFGSGFAHMHHRREEWRRHHDRCDRQEPAAPHDAPTPSSPAPR
jgi:hypothetical protein